MPYVIKLSTGYYVSVKGWARRHSRGSADLNDAVTFKRRCDASNCASGEFTGHEVVEVTLTEVQKPCS